MTQYAETLKAIMAAALKPDVDRFVDFLADDVEYHFHVSTPPVRGKDGVRRFMAKYGTIAGDPLWRVDRTAQAGNCLFVEGYEEYTDKRTGERIAHPYMGILEFGADGKITKWRDYFEMNQKKKESA
jgi:limonene-1,2-epoxide hydrolase